MYNELSARLGLTDERFADLGRRIDSLENKFDSLENAYTKDKLSNMNYVGSVSLVDGMRSLANCRLVLITNQTDSPEAI